MHSTKSNRNPAVLLWTPVTGRWKLRRGSQGVRISANLSAVAREDAQQTHASDRKLTDVWISPVQMPLIYSHASSSFFSPLSSIFESTTRSPWR